MKKTHVAMCRKKNRHVDTPLLAWLRQLSGTGRGAATGRMAHAYDVHVLDTIFILNHNIKSINDMVV